MTSWKLWQALRHPPYRNPVYRRVVTAAVTWRLPAIPWHQISRLAMIVVTLVVVVMVWVNPISIGFLSLLLFFAPFSLMLLLLLMPLIIPAIVMMLGAWWAASISTTITGEHDRATYDLLCLFPGGRLGTHWAIACGIMQRGSAFGIVVFIVGGLLLLGLVFVAVMILLGLVVSLNLPPEAALEERLVVIRTVLDVFVLASAYGLHHLHSVVLGPLVGMLVPVVIRGRIEAYLASFGMYLAVQAVTYAVWWLVGWGLVLPLLTALNLNPWLVMLGEPVILLGLLVLIREGTVFWLWRLASQLLLADRATLAKLLAPYETGEDLISWMRR